MDPVLSGTLSALVPVLVVFVVFGSPALILYILRDFRFREKQLNLTHDERLARTEHERDMLQLQVDQMTSELEFTRNLLVGVAPQLAIERPAQVRVKALAAAPSADDSDEVSADTSASSARRQR